MSLEKETLANSELTYYIIRELLDSEKTPTELSQGLDTSSQSVNNYLKRLGELNAIEKREKRGRKQPYGVNKEDLQNFLYQLFRDYLSSNIGDDQLTQDALETEMELYNVWTPYDIREALSKDAKVVLIDFFDFYLEFNENSTLNEMFEAFLDGVEMSEIEELDVGWIYGLKALAKKRHDYTKDPEALFTASVMEYKTYPDTIEKKNEFLLNVKGEDYLKKVEYRPQRTCPECGVPLPNDYKVDLEDTNICPKCDAEFETVQNEIIYECPECGSEIENPKHEEETKCGCGYLLNLSENEKEVQSFEESNQN